MVWFNRSVLRSLAKISDYSGKDGLKTKPQPMIVLGMKEQDLDCKMPTFSYLFFYVNLRKDMLQ